MIRIRAGIVGMGAAGIAHLEAIRRLGYAEAAAAVVRDREKARLACETLNLPRCYQDYREMLKDPQIQVVHNCTPNREHFPVNRDALKAGRHVLSEKPLTLSPDESFELAALAEDRGLKAGVNFVYRHFPAIRELRATLAAGELGKIFAVHGAYLQDWLLLPTDYNWRVEREQSGPSRAFADIGSHWIDMACHLLGDEIIEVSADLATFIPKRTRLSAGGESRTVAVDTEDYAAVLLRFRSGARGCLTVSQASAGRKSSFSIQVDGSLASAAWSTEEAGRLWIGRRDGPNRILVEHPSTLRPEAASFEPFPPGTRSRWPDAQKDLIDSFYRSLLFGEPPSFATFKEAHRVMLVVEAVLESHRTGSWKTITP